MPYSIEWFNEDHNILVVSYTGRWTWEEVQLVSEQVLPLYEQANGRVDCICDMTGSAWVPPNFGQLVTEVTATTYPNLHLVVYVSHPFFRELIQTYDRNFQPLPFEVGFADSIKEAFDLILKDRGRNGQA